MHGSIPLACLCFPVVLGTDCFKSGPCHVYTCIPPSAMWVSIASDAACAAALQQAVADFGIVDTDALQAVLQILEAWPHRLH